MGAEAAPFDPTVPEAGAVVAESTDSVEAEVGMRYFGLATRAISFVIDAAVIDLVAAVGLWLAAAWGGVVWLTAAISMAAIELFFPQVYGGRLWIAIPEFLAISIYIGLALMAGRERPE